MTQHHGMTIAARLPDGRLLLARIDPRTPARRSPLQQALRAAGIWLEEPQGEGASDKRPPVRHA